jgi:signal transduction histidine kinase
MNSRRTLIIVGVATLLVGLILVVTSTAVPSAPASLPWLLNLSTGTCFVLSGFALCALAWPVSVAQVPARVAALVLGILDASAAITVIFDATVAKHAFVSAAGAANQSITATEFQLLTALSGLVLALGIGAFTLTARRRVGTTIAAAAGLVSAILGLGALVGWLAVFPTEGPDLFDASVISVFSMGVGATLYFVARLELTPATSGEVSPTFDALFTTVVGSSVGILVMSGALFLGLFVRDAEDFERLSDIDQFRDSLEALDESVQTAVAFSRQFTGTREVIDPLVARQKWATVETQVTALEQFPARVDQASIRAALVKGIRAIVAQSERALEQTTGGHTLEATQTLADLDRSGLIVRFSSQISRLSNALRMEVTERGAPRSQRRHVIIFVIAVSGLTIPLMTIALHLFVERHVALRHHAESALRKHNETLRAFAHTVAHDLRAPLRGIAGYATELETYAPFVGPRGRHCITQINRSAQNLERLVGDTLEYSQLDAETPRLTTITLPTLIASLLQQRAPEIRKNGTLIDTNFGVTTVTSWERGLVQIIGNLLDNALKYSRNAKPPRLRIETAQTPLAWRLLINDNGIGFDMKYHDRIFGLFQRLVTIEEFEGTGAGLAIVKKIVDRLGGTIRAEGKPGVGATFFIELPRLGPADRA